MPEEYQQVEYIESTGSQYIDTGYLPNQDTRIISDFVVTSLAQSNNGFLFGSRISASNENISITWDEGKSYIGRGNRFYYYAYSPDIGNKAHIDYSKDKIIIDSKTVTSVASDFEGEFPIYIFGCNENGTKIRSSYYQVSILKIYDTDVLVRDFIPCYRKSDNVAGLYDLVNNVFYVNQGTEDDFTVGADVTIPNPDYPQEIYSVGDLVEDETDEHYGKYKIPITITVKDYATIPEDYSGTKSGITILSEDGKLKYNGTATNTYLSTDSFTLDVPLKAGTKYVGKTTLISGDMKGTRFKIWGYNKDKVLKLNILFNSQFTPSENIYTYKIVLEEMVKENEYNFEAEFSIINKNYTPQTANIYLDAPLRKIGDYADILNFKNRKVTRNIRNMQLKNTSFASAGVANIAYSTAISDYAVSDSNICLCTHFQGTENVAGASKMAEKDMNTCAFYSSKSFIRLYIKSEMAVGDLNTFLKSNNAELDYATSKPTEENFSADNLHFYSGTNIVTIDTDTQPSAIEVVYYKEIEDTIDDITDIVEGGGV